MKRHPPVEVGFRYGLLTVIAEERPHRSHKKFRSLCDCGNTVVSFAMRLKDGSATSCGCAVVRTKQTAETFWSKYNRDADSGCWNWTGSLTRSGYGQVKYRGQQMLAHRVAAHLSGKLRDISKQQTGATGLLVCHHCDNKLCGNPDHLYLGSAKTNAADARARNRIEAPRGESHHAARLTEEDVRTVKNSPSSDSELAELFGVGARQIRKIRSGKSWAHVT